jgi:hypothetical protein
MAGIPVFEPTPANTQTPTLVAITPKRRGKSFDRAVNIIPRAATDLTNL